MAGTTSHSQLQNAFFTSRVVEQCLRVTAKLMKSHGAAHARKSASTAGASVLEAWPTGPKILRFADFRLFHLSPPLARPAITSGFLGDAPHAFHAFAFGLPLGFRLVQPGGSAGAPCPLGGQLLQRLSPGLCLSQPRSN